MEDPDIRKQGFLRRLKTLKRRYFVLRSLSPLGKARLEYYENEKKFRAKLQPRRAIHLASCFSIARKGDTRQKFAFVLYTRQDVFGLVAETHEELNSWLEVLLDEKEKSEESQDIGTFIQPVWNVIIKPRGLGTSRNLVGSFQLKLTNQALLLTSKACSDHNTELELTSIRRCGHTDCFFFIEVGRSAVTGAGEMWIQVDDPLLAQHMHECILGAMHSLSDGQQTGTIKARPTSLLLSPPVRSRSDTSPDSPPPPRVRMGSSSRDRNPSESDSPKPSKAAMFSRFLSGGRKKELAQSVPRGRRVQSKSLSVEPGHRSLLSRAQSMDFSRMFSGLELQSPGSPDSAKDIDFGELIEPVRTMSNSSGSSGYSSGRSWDTQVKAITATSNGDQQVEYINMTSPKPDDVSETENEYVSMEAGDNDTLKRTKDDVKMDGGDTVSATIKVGETQSEVRMTQRLSSGYEDMSSQTLTRESSIDMEDKKQTSNPQVEQIMKSSPKQKRTSQEGPTKAEIRELVNLKSSPNTTPSSSPIRSLGKTTKGSPGTSSRRKHEDYMFMSPVSNVHTYVNFRPGEGMEGKSSAEPRYMNVAPPTNTKEGTLKEPSYMNFNPGDATDVLSLSEEPDYMNVNPCRQDDSETKELPGYMNLCPLTKNTSSPKLVSEKRRKHTYENVSMEGQLAPQEPDYINVSPRKSQGLNHVNTLPSRKSTGGLPISKRGVPRRRESEPAKGLSDEEAGMLFLDFSKKKREKEEEATPLNYISLDLSKKDDALPKGLPKWRPTKIDFSHSRLHKHHSDLGPMSAPARTSYSEIDFTRSQALRQARLEKQKPKS